MRNASKQSGQALVEYILILTVVVAMVLGGIYQLNKAFQFWANNYFGEYMMCLLETGELPTIGQAPDPNSECFKAFQAFSFNYTPGPGGPNNPGGGGNDDGGDNGDDSSDSGGSGSGGGQGTVGSRSSPTNSAESKGTASSRDAGNSAGTASRFRSQGSRGGGESGIEEENIGAAAAPGSIGGTGGEGSSTRISASNLGKSTRKKTEEKEVFRSQASTKSEDKKGKTGGLIPVKKTVTEETKDAELEGFTFGMFLRYLIIAAIVIAIIIFIGGQVLQVSKSME